MAPAPDRRALEQEVGAAAAQRERRRNPPDDFRRSIAGATRARHRSDNILAARGGHGPSSRRRVDQRGLGLSLQRADPSGVQAVSVYFHWGGNAAAEPSGFTQKLHRRA